MLPQTRAPEITDPPTYGGLLDDVRRSLEVAAETTVDPADPAPHINGYERFLRSAGANLALLGSFTNHRPDGTGTLQAKLLRLPHHDAGTTVWDDAATRLGAAHDLVATHLGPDNQYRSPEAADLFTQSGGLVATRDVTDLILVAATTTGDLVRLAPNDTNHPTTGVHNRFFLTGLNRELLLYGKAVMWDLETQLRRTTTNQMAGLQPALLPRPTTAPSFSSPIQALRLLRQATYSQARGQAAASAASLHDLACLGERVATQVRDHLPPPETGLARVEAAHLHDQLDRMQAAWSRAGRDLGQQIRSVTKAPATYGSAVTHLLQTEDLTLPVCTAVLAALPRMGNDSAETIRRLTRARLLATPTRELGRLSPPWRPLELLDGHVLAERFVAAATSTRATGDQVRRIASPSTRQPPAPLPLPQRTRNQHRQVTHP